MKQIATATDEQHKGVSRVNDAMAQIDRLTQDNAARAKQEAAACSELSRQVVVLDDAVDSLRRLVGGSMDAVPPG